MGTVYLLEVVNKMKDLDPQGLKLLDSFPMVFSFKDAHKNTLNLNILTNKARGLKGIG